MINHIRTLLTREERLRSELRDVSAKLSSIREALGMRPDEAPQDYRDSENANPYVTIKNLVIGAVYAAHGPVTTAAVIAALSSIRELTSQQVGQALVHAARDKHIAQVGRGVYAPLGDAATTTPPSFGEDT